MSTIDPSVVKAVFTLADAAIVPELVDRLGDELGPALRSLASVPGPLADAVRAGGDPVLLEAVEAVRARRERLDPPVARPFALPAFADPDARTDLTAEELDALLDLDDPLVDARLFAGSVLDRTERTRLLAGVRRDGTVGPVPTALTDLLWAAELGRCARWLAAGMASGDAEVARIVVNRLPLRTEAGRLRLILGVWARHGRDEVRRVLAEADFPAEARAEIEEALGRRDGRAVLGARLADFEVPEHIVEFLCSGGDSEQPDRVDGILDDGGTIPWPELIRAHRTTPLPAALHARLAELPDCPNELLIALLAEGLPRSNRDDRPWLHTALVAGRLTGADVMEHARPAAVALSILAGTDGRTSPARWASGAPRARAYLLADRYLGTNVEAWIVALRLFPDFTGTIPELLATADAVTGNRAGAVG
ncbi:hypothetical protein B4N89_32005 [Embleya scabrispora]|uniref:Uncharacterized protein n=1 Tax=Embleya scabrispora TaxID=159449 RepID=A0A1T3NPM5_9ACTN|nr:hypothetical protein [Embleya scabrispora]OPC78776.1 hypothetical protein B4N89_32005 [Embleya scabrispora]